MTIPLATLAFFAHATLATFLLALIVGLAFDWHLHYLAQARDHQWT